MAETRNISGKVEEQHSGKRLDAVLALIGGGDFSRSRISEYGSDFTVNGRSAKLSLKVHSGDSIFCTVTVPEPFTDFQPEDIPLEVVYEDDQILVINKAAGMPVHPSCGHKSGTVVNALLYRYNDLPGEKVRPGIVHRLDKDTSGLLVCAKTLRALQSLTASFKKRDIGKQYHAIVKNRPVPAKGLISASLGRDPRNRKKQAVTNGANSRSAKTGYRTLELFEKYALLQLDLFTGRTHQIRVHLSHIGCPIVGDPLYSRNNRTGTGLCLAATSLSLPHPETGERMSFSAVLPEHMTNFLKTLRGN